MYLNSYVSLMQYPVILKWYMTVKFSFHVQICQRSLMISFAYQTIKPTAYHHKNRKLCIIYWLTKFMSRILCQIPDNMAHKLAAYRHPLL